MCVCVCVTGGVLHTFPPRGVYFHPQALGSHLLKCELSSQDEGSTWGYGCGWGLEHELC